MQEDFDLKADLTPIELDQSGLTLVAPGLIGTGTWQSRPAPGETRDFSLGNADFDRALAEAGLSDRHTLTIAAPTPQVAPSATRGFGEVADDELLLQVPLGAEEAALVLYADEAGRLSLHYAEPAATAPPALPTRAFGADHLARFRLRLRSGQSGAAGATRGLVGSLLDKVIKVLILDRFPDQAGDFGVRRVRAWEERNRADGRLHGGTWEQLLDPVPTPLADLGSLRGKPALLFIHGTTSTTAGAFGGLRENQAVLERLYAGYGGRVLGFEHHTMGASVTDNVAQFHAALAAAPGDYRFDIICHSRGGLLARALAHLSGTAIPAPPGVNLRIGRIVFVATPNAGTPLADPQCIPGCVERLVNVVNFLPDSAGTLAVGGLLAVAAALVEVSLPRLPGLADQAPGSPLQQALAPPPGGSDGFYALASDFAASGDLREVVMDAAADRLFGHTGNDLVVPAEGVAQTPWFSLPETRSLRFPRERAVHHSRFFSQPEMVRLPDWLGQP